MIQSTVFPSRLINMEEFYWECRSNPLRQNFSLTDVPVSGNPYFKYWGSNISN